MPIDRSWVRTFAREPLVHFAVLGAALFALHARVAKPPPERIEVTSVFADALRSEQAERSGRPLTDDETRALLTRYVDEEVLYREALALGLDRGDVIVRRRLVQKMELLARASIREPSEAELAEHLAAHPERYRAAGAISFRHVFVSRDRHGAGAPEKAESLLAALRAGAEPASLGDPFVAGAGFVRRTRDDLKVSFGGGFADGAFAAPVGEWSGPLASSYGLHLVLVDARAAAAPPDLAAIRPRVRDDFSNARREAALRDEIERLRGRYQVIFEGSAP